MRSLWIVCVAVALSAQPASAERAERWRAMAQDWAVDAGCEVAGAALVASTGNEEIYTFTCGAPPVRFVKVRCARYRHSAPIRPTPWCVAGSLSDGTLYDR